MPMTRAEAAAHQEEAVRQYQARNYGRAAELYADLFVEPEAMAGIHGIHWNYAICQAHLGNFPLALEHVGASGYSEQEFHAACAADNIVDARAELSRAYQLFQGERWQEAADAFVGLLLHPGFPSDEVAAVHWNVAACFAHLDDFHTALQHVGVSGHSEQEFREACRQWNVRDARHDYAHAGELFRAHRWQEACDEFAALLLHPGFPAEEVAAMHWNVAMCFAHLGDWHTALQHVGAGQHDEHRFREECTRGGLHPPAQDQH